MAKLTLQEQMLKAGLVSSKKLEKAKKSSKKSRVQNREAKAAVEANKQAQLERDKALSQEQKQQTLSKELKAQVKQLIAMNQIVIENGDISYNFTDGTVVKTLWVDQAIQKQLTQGRLAIARYQEGYAIIPATVADKIAQRDENSIVLNNVLTEEAKQDDDPYADYAIPDDLMW